MRFLEEKVQLKSLATTKTHLKWLHAHLGGVFLDAIDSDRIASIRRAKVVLEITETGELVVRNPATVNRVLEVVLAILRKARDEWQWIDRIPNVPMYTESKGRVRWITVEQVEQLMKELPQHQKAMALFDLQVGVRQANVRLLEWSWVNWERGTVTFPPYAMKSGEHHTVALNEGARYVLELQRDMHPKYVFPYRGKPVQKVSTRAWREALGRAGITDFRWHDLRHTWASWLRQKRVPLDIIRQLGGWLTLAMVERYAHLDVGHLAEYSDQLPNVAKTMTKTSSNASRDSAGVLPTGASNVIHVTFSAQGQKEKGHS